MDGERFTCGRRGRRWKGKREGCGGVNVFAMVRQGPARSTSVGSVDRVNYLILSSSTEIASKQLRTVLRFEVSSKDSGEQIRA